MAIIVGSNEDIGDAYAPSLNAALTELGQAANRAPVVRAPYGGLRTIAQQLAISPGVANPASSDHVKGRAVDIDNHATLRARIGSSRFVAILAKWGWRNVDLSGNPFPSEPWHFANRSSTPAGSGGTAIPGAPTDYTINLQQEEATMFVRADTSNNVFEIYRDHKLNAPRMRLLGKYEASWVKDLAPSLARVSSAENFNALAGEVPMGVPAPDTDPDALSRIITAALDAALADINIPTPQISDVDKQQIIDGVVAKFGAVITNG